MIKIIFSLLNLLRLLLCPSMWTVLENVPCALEKKVYSGFFGCNVLKISIKSNCCVFRISVALFIFSLEYLSNDMNVAFKRPIFVFPSVSPFMPASICFMCLNASTILGAYTLTNVKSYSCTAPFSLYNVFLYLSMWLFILKSILSDRSIATSTYSYLYVTSFSISSFSIYMCPLQ